VPVVEAGEFVDKVHQSRNVSLGIVVHDLLGCNGRSQCRVADELLVDEAGQRWHQRPIGNGGVVRTERTVKLEVIAGNGVIRVVQNGIEFFRVGTKASNSRVTQILRVAVRAIVDGIIEARSRDTPKDVVERTVLQYNPNDILDLGLKVLDGVGRTRLVAKRSIVDLAKGRTRFGHGSKCHRQKAEKSSCSLHPDLEYRIGGAFAASILIFSRGRPVLLFPHFWRSIVSFISVSGSIL
jgi:hypothetical protein